LGLLPASPNRRDPVRLEVVNNRRTSHEIFKLFLAWLSVSLCLHGDLGIEFARSGEKSEGKRQKLQSCAMFSFREDQNIGRRGLYDFEKVYQGT